MSDAHAWSSPPQMQRQTRYISTTSIPFLPNPQRLRLQCSLDTANELFGNLFDTVDVNAGAFRVESSVSDFRGDDKSDKDEEEGLGQELWPASPYGSMPMSPYGSPYGGIPTSPYEMDRETTSEFLDGDEFGQRLKFGTKAPPVNAVPMIAAAVGHAAAAAAVGHAPAAAVHTTPISVPATDDMRASPGSSESKMRKSKYRTPPLLPHVRAAIDKVRKGRQSVRMVAATTLYNGKPLMSERTLRRCVEQSQGDITSVFYYPLLKMETPLKTGRKNKRHVTPHDQRAAAAGPSDRYSAMTVRELKAELRSRGLKQTGRKADHQQRLRESDQQLTL